jgi:hypothetical protein
MRRMLMGFPLMLLLTCVAIAGAETIDGQTDLQYLSATEAELKVADALPEADPARGGARMSAMQALASARAVVGDHPGATRAFVESLYALRGQSLPDAAATTGADREYARSILAAHRPQPALAAIVHAARDRQIVILNESHQLSRHRAFGTELALALRKIGFKYLAMETLDVQTEALAKRGYPLRYDGWYSKDPVFGDFIRQSLRAGFIPVAYEHTTEQEPNTGDWALRINAREEGQANNLIERVLKRDPAARIFVYVGFSHVLKGSEAFDGKTTTWMAERLRLKTGIDPLCIDETKITQPLPGTRDRSFLDAIFAATKDDVVVLADGKLRDRYYAFDPDRVDMQVFHRPPRIDRGREDWLAMHGYRKPRAIPTELLPASGRRLIQAFVANEAVDAVPMDQVLVTAGETPPVFMLPKGKYRFAYEE